MIKTRATLQTIMAGILLGFLGLGSHALAQTSDPALNALVKKGILTEAEAKQALAEAEAQKKAAASTEKNINPFVFKVGDEFKMKLGGFIQGNGEFGDVGSFEGFFSDNPAKAIDRSTGKTRSTLHDRFRLRRARLNVTGEFLERFDFKLEGDFEQGDGISSSRTAFSGTDLFVNWNQFPEANIKFGQYKAPFGLEQITPDTTLFFVERSLPTIALTPERQTGVQLWGKPLTRVSSNYKDLFDYAFGVFNGNGRNTTINDDAHFMYVGRIGVTPFTGTLFEQPVKWRLGGNGLYSRYAQGTRISPTGNLLENPDGSLSKFEAPDTAESVGWGVDQSLMVGPFELIAEYLQQTIRPKHSTAFPEFTADGYYVQGSYFFPGKKFQLAARWEQFNPGQAEHDDIRSITGGLNYYILGNNIKLMFDYVHTWSDFRDHHPQFGKDQFDMGLVRLQLMF